ncbi:MAG: hypothetical protein MJ071_06015 [Oscillospiraceae bacterium]|nr:hypothetical protein [Oscillospiraceae bacterium]
MKRSLKVNKKGLIVIAAVFLLAVGWYIIWDIIRVRVQDAAYESVYDALTFDGAYYQKCNLETVQYYLEEVQTLDESLCGTQLGELSFPTKAGQAQYPVFACSPMEQNDMANALLIMEREGQYVPYELTGFQYLDSNPDIWAVCASYGIGAAKDFAEVVVKDQDGIILQSITEEEALSQFFDRFVKLGDSMTDEAQAQAYYDAYVDAFGESENLYIENGQVQAKTDEIYQEAYEFWVKDMRLVDLKLTNGLQIRGCIYLPVPKIFSVYGDYAVTESFFE